MNKICIFCCTYLQAISVDFTSHLFTKMLINPANITDIEIPFDIGQNDEKIDS